MGKTGQEHLEGQGLGIQQLRTLLPHLGIMTIIILMTRRRLLITTLEPLEVVRLREPLQAHIRKVHLLLTLPQPQDLCTIPKMVIHLINHHPLLLDTKPLPVRIHMFRLLPRVRHINPPHHLAMVLLHHLELVTVL